MNDVRPQTLAILLSGMFREMPGEARGSIAVALPCAMLPPSPRRYEARFKRVLPRRTLWSAVKNLH